MESTVWVCWRSGSGSREMWTHSGIVTVPPSRSAMITSNWKHTHTQFLSLLPRLLIKAERGRIHKLIAATEGQTQRQTKSSPSTAAHYGRLATKQQNAHSYFTVDGGKGCPKDDLWPLTTLTWLLYKTQCLVVMRDNGSIRAAQQQPHAVRHL